MLRRLAPLVLVIPALIAYQNSLDGPFVFDDQDAIIENPSIRRLDLRAILDPRSDLAVSGRPLVNFSFALNYAAGGLEVRGYHAVNIALHVLSTLLLFGVVRRTLAGPRLASAWTERAWPLALASALLWSVHPLQTEAVNYVVQRTELLMGLCFLLTLYALLRAAASSTGRGRATWQALGVVGCLAGMASKEVMAVCPVVVLLHDAIFVSGSVSGALRSRSLFYGGLALSWALLILLMSGGPRMRSVGLRHGVSSLEYARVQLAVLVRYLGLAVWPRPLIFDYGDWFARDSGPVLLKGLLVGMLLLGTLLALWRSPPLGYLGAWFFLILAPTSSFVPIVTEWAAERRMYLPLAAIVVGVAVGVDRLLGRLPVAWAGRMRGLALLLCATGLGGATLARNESYRSEVILWREALRDRPSNPRAWYHIGHAIERERKKEMNANRDSR